MAGSFMTALSFKYLAKACAADGGWVQKLWDLNHLKRAAYPREGRDPRPSASRGLVVFQPAKNFSNLGQISTRFRPPVLAE